MPCHVSSRLAVLNGTSRLSVFFFSSSLFHSSSISSRSPLDPTPSRIPPECCLGAGLTLDRLKEVALLGLVRILKQLADLRAYVGDRDLCGLRVSVSSPSWAASLSFGSRLSRQRGSYALDIVAVSQVDFRQESIGSTVQGWFGDGDVLSTPTRISIFFRWGRSGVGAPRKSHMTNCTSNAPDTRRQLAVFPQPPHRHRHSTKKGSCRGESLLCEPSNEMSTRNPPQ
jgi:hypothetical protein